MITAILFFLAIALLFYVLFGGADFGAGILELRLRGARIEEQQKLVSRAMAPVWEANHVWLILAIVILFMGFPAAYSVLSVHLHLPVTAILLGIVARGSAFTFRHYDTLTKQYYKAYSRVFAWSSLWTSLFLGMVAGAMYLGRIDPDATTYYGLYVAPWLNPFCLMVGAFVCCLFAFLAAVYLAGETRDADLARLFQRKAVAANVASVITGGLVFAAGEIEGAGFLRAFFSEPFSIASFVAATLLLAPFWRAARRAGRVTLSRALAVAIVSLVLFGGWMTQYPAAYRYTTGGAVMAMSFFEVAAPGPTLKALLWALSAGICLVLPALAYLFKVFKWETLESRRFR